MNTNSIKCPVCGTGKVTFLEELPIREQFQLYSSDSDVVEKMMNKSGLGIQSYHMSDCCHCRVIFSSPMLAPTGDWYSYAYNVLQFHASDRWEFKHVIQHTPENARLGEIGCGTGMFLNQCKSHHIQSRGIDFSPDSIKTCIEKGLRAEVFNIANGDINFAPELDVVVSFHVIEHLEKPNRIFEIANQWCKPEAVLWVAVPSDRRIGRLNNLKEVFDEPPHHLTKWSESALKEIGLLNGWEMTELIYPVPDYGQRLYEVTIHSGIYKAITRLTGKLNRWFDRILRYSIYPFILLFNCDKVNKLTGHAMMAKYRRK